MMTLQVFIIDNTFIDMLLKSIERENLSKGNNQL
jgi:hypothetical protein